MRVAKALAIASDNWLIKYTMNIKKFHELGHFFIKLQFCYKEKYHFSYFCSKQRLMAINGSLIITSQHMRIWSLSHVRKIAHQTCMNNYLVVPDALILA